MKIGDVPSLSIRLARARRQQMQCMWIIRTSADGKLMAGSIGRLYQLLWNGPHVRAAEAFERRHSANTLFGIALSAFLLLWMLSFCVSNASVDIHFDLSEASVWAEQFAFGYKHPPMTAWLFSLWFSMFPRADWAAYLLAVTTVTVTLAITWRLVRDYLDKERALVGMAALMMVPLFTFLASRLNANTVMMPFWAAAQLFYLRARRDLRMSDAVLAGVFVGLTFLGKYWAIYLAAGMAITSLLGSGTGRFWRSPAPYLMGLSASLIVAPHVYWFVTDRGQATQDFMADSVMVAQPFGTALLGSISYLAGSVAYVAVPLLYLIILQPSKAAVADILWPRDKDRQQAHLLFLLPLVLPALANMVFPHRLTALWTFPDWALLPVVLFGSPLIKIYPVGAARAALVAVSVSLTAVLAAPYVAYFRVTSKAEMHERHYRQVAEEILRLSKSPQSIAGTREIVQGLFFYLPEARPIQTRLLSDSTALAGVRATSDVVIVCSGGDEPCRSSSSALASLADRPTNFTFTRTFFGFTASPATYHFTIISTEAPNP
jgi:4-amino-4-deoxy-L-arabinose transferase-like glycosyltransferase